MSLLVTCPQLTAEYTPLLDAAAIPWLLPWLMLCNSARANTNANTLKALPSNTAYFTSSTRTVSSHRQCLQQSERTILLASSRGHQLALHEREDSSKMIRPGDYIVNMD